MLIGANVFSKERKRYFESRIEKLLKRIQSVEDSDFYNKDMEAKGRAERDLLTEVESLREEFVQEAQYEKLI